MQTNGHRDSREGRNSAGAARRVIDAELRFVRGSVWCGERSGVLIAVVAWRPARPAVALHDRSACRAPAWSLRRMRPRGRCSCRPSRARTTGTRLPAAQRPSRRPSDAASRSPPAAGRLGRARRRAHGGAGEPPSAALAPAVERRRVAGRALEHAATPSPTRRSRRRPDRPAVAPAHPSAAPDGRAPGQRPSATSAVALPCLQSSCNQTDGSYTHRVHICEENSPRSAAETSERSRSER